MKKITYILLLLLVIGSCKFAEKPYSFEREFEGGTYITPEGIVKYISGAPDSAVTVSDVYAIIKEEITYHKAGAQQGDGTTIHADSILIYGHCFSEEPDPRAIEGDKMNNIDDLKNCAYYFNGDTEPTGYISITDLGTGTSFQSSLGLLYETDYYIKSFVVTGRITSSGPVYEDIAYNQYELQVATKKPVDLWVGGGMDNSPPSFPDNEFRGATSFSYNGYMFVTQGHNESDLGSKIVVHRYDPISNAWDYPYPEFTDITADENFTNAVSFVINDVEVTTGTYHDCVYIGTGFKKNTGFATNEFFRLDLENGNWVRFNTTYDAQEFIGGNILNAVAFSINGIGYVGLGNVVSGNTPLDYFYKFDPADRAPGHGYGKWTQIDKFPGGAITKAVTFKLGDNVYVCCGENSSGTKLNDVWMCRQTTADKLSWSRKASFEGTPRINAVGFNVGEMGYIGTGLDDSGPTKDFWRYNPFLDVWEERKEYGGAARSQAVGEGIKISDSDYRGYIGTGWNSVSLTYYKDFWHYRP